MNISEYIIYENLDLIALDKPAGFLSIPDGYNPSIPNLKKVLEDKFGKIWIVHRLDKETSGVIIFAKNAEMHRKLNMAFSMRKISKTYQAIIYGFPFWESKEISYPLRVNGDRKHRTVVDLNKGKQATTLIEIKEKHQGHSFAIVKPKSGLTHQIRAHLMAVGHPIIGDDLYSYLRGKGIEEKPPSPLKDDGLFLHAAKIVFQDLGIDLPVIEAPLPKKFLDFGWSDSNY